MLSTKPKSSVALQFVVKVTGNLVNSRCNSDLKARFADDGVNGSNVIQANKCVQGNLNEPLTLEMIVHNDNVNDPV